MIEFKLVSLKLGKNIDKKVRTTIVLNSKENKESYITPKTTSDREETPTNNHRSESITKNMQFTIRVF